MLKDIKDILFREIKEEVEQYEAAKSRIDTINLRIDEISLILHNKDQARDDIEALERPSKPSILTEKISFWEKIFNRKKYLSLKRMHIEAQEKYNKEVEEYDKQRSEYIKEWKALVEEKELLEKRCREIEEKGIRDKFESIKNAKTLKDLGISFEEAVKLLEENGIQLVLDESDRTITYNKSEFDKPEDFILVHKTAYAPANDEVKSNAIAGAKYTYAGYVDGEEFSYEVSQARNTVHFCQNGEVSSHCYGNFEGRKYAVLIPFASVKNNINLASFNPEDTFFDGKVDIKDGYILCPIEEVEEIQRLNPNSNVIGYKGDSVDGFANAFLSILGYRCEEINEHSWKSDFSMAKQSEFVITNMMKRGAHAKSKEESRDNLLGSFNRITGFTESVIDSKDKGKRYNIQKLTRLVFKDNDFSPSYTSMMRKATSTYMGDFIEEKGFKYDLNKDFATNNRELLFHILEKNFDIKIPQQIKEILADDTFFEDKHDSKNISAFINTIPDEETRRFLDDMVQNGEIMSIDKIKDVLFVKTIIEEVYRERTKKVEKNDDSDEPELY